MRFKIIIAITIAITIATIYGFTALENCELKTEDKEIERILSRIQAPEFPDKIFNVMDFQEMIFRRTQFQKQRFQCY